MLKRICKSWSPHRAIVHCISLDPANLHVCGQELFALLSVFYRLTVTSTEVWDRLDGKKRQTFYRISWLSEAPAFLKECPKITFTIVKSEIFPYARMTPSIWVNSQTRKIRGRGRCNKIEGREWEYSFGLGTLMGLWRIKVWSSKWCWRESFSAGALRVSRVRT